MNKVKVHWLYNKELSAVEPLLQIEDRISVCIDKDTVVESLLRVILSQLETDPFEIDKIHCWITHNNTQFYFINDLQNDLVKINKVEGCSV
jgi:hypothetical protein